MTGLFDPFRVVANAALQYLGAGVWFRWQRWVAYVVAVSLVATILILALATAGVFDFKDNFNELAGAGSYDRIVAGTVASSFSFGESLQFMIWPAFSIWFAVSSVSFSGEIKNVQTGQLVGINGAIITMGLAMTLLMFFYRGAFGEAFILASPESVDYTLAAPPFVNVFTGIAGGNVVLTVLTSLWTLGIGFFLIGTCLLYGTRAMLAWSIDGIAPDRLGDVSERRHSPHWTILIGAVIGLAWLGMFAFTDLLGPISGFLGLAVSFVAVSLTALVFPYRKRQAFESSPVAWRVGGVPAISLIALVSSVVTIYVFARLTIDSSFTPNLKFSNFGAAAVVAVAVIWFFGARAIRRRGGVNIDQRYAEIPIE